MGNPLGVVIRTARATRGWTQSELAERLCCSASTVSRLETGARQQVDVATLRRVAKVLGIPAVRLGITATVAGEPPAEDEVLRRRELLNSLAVTAAATALPTRTASGNAQAAPGVRLVSRTRDAILGLGREYGDVIPLPRLRAALVGAIEDYDACRYDRLTDGLPRLIASGHQAGEDAAQVLAETYNLATRLVIKLDPDDRVGWVAADRARTLADRVGAPLVAAEAARNLAVLARRAGWYSQATDIAIGAAEADALDGPAPALVAERGLLVMSAAYTAAHASDRTGMRELTAQATAIAAGLTGRFGGGVLLGDHGGGFSSAAVRLHLISAEYTAGDPAAAITAARALSPQTLPTAERRGRYLTDVARAYALWGRRSECVTALLAAERVAPAETRSRPAVRALVTNLLDSGRTTADLRRLAARCGIR